MNSTAQRLLPAIYFGSTGSHGSILPGRGSNLSVCAEPLRLFLEGSMATPWIPEEPLFLWINLNR